MELILVLQIRAAAASADFGFASSQLTEIWAEALVAQLNNEDGRVREADAKYRKRIIFIDLPLFECSAFQSLS